MRGEDRPGAQEVWDSLEALSSRAVGGCLYQTEFGLNPGDANQAWLPTSITWELAGGRARPGLH